VVAQLADRSSCNKLLVTFERELIQSARLLGFKLNEFIQKLANDNSMMEKDSEYSSSTPHDNIEGVISPGGSSMMFVNEWLSAIADSIIALFLSDLLKISSISNMGSLQLVTDLDYLRYCCEYLSSYVCFTLFGFCSNVISAMGIRPHPLLVFTRTLLTEDNKALNQSLNSLQSSG
jgi:hypothetical protein